MESESAANRERAMSDRSGVRRIKESDPGRHQGNGVPWKTFPTGRSNRDKTWRRDGWFDDTLLESNQFKNQSFTIRLYLRDKSDDRRQDENRQAGKRLRDTLTFLSDDADDHFVASCRL